VKRLPTEIADVIRYYRCIDLVQEHTNT